MVRDNFEILLLVIGPIFVELLVLLLLWSFQLIFFRRTFEFGLILSSSYSYHEEKKDESVGHFIVKLLPVLQRIN